MSLSDICLVIDFDGFFIGKTFYPREMGFYSMTENYAGSHRFRLNHLVGNITKENWRTIDYCTKYIHGLSFRTLPEEKGFFELKHLKMIVLEDYRVSKKWGKDLIAYKGGHVERDHLEDWGLPCVNLEDFGCPKYNQLPRPDIEDCGYHKNFKNRNLSSEPIHCAKVECKAFAEWIKNNSWWDD